MEPLSRSPGDQISIGEAATRIFVLSNQDDIKLSLPVKCDKYYHLFQNPNYQAEGHVKELMSLERGFSEIEQRSANLEAKLSAELQYNALKRLSRLHEVLVQEGVGLNSSLDVRVQMSILECITYYKERHARAIEGLSEYIKTKKDKIPLSAGTVYRVYKLFDELTAELEKLERNMKFMTTPNVDNIDRELMNKWKHVMVKLYRLKDEHEILVTKSVADFLNHPKRRDEVAKIGALVKQVEDIKRNVLSLEGKKESLSDYRDSLLELNQILEDERGWLPDYRFMENDRRRSVVLGADYRARNDGELPKPEALIRLKQPMSVSKPEMTDMIVAGLSSNLKEEPETSSEAPESPEASEISQFPERLESKNFSLTRTAEFPKQKRLEQFNLIFYVSEDFDKIYSDDDQTWIAIQAINDILVQKEAECQAELALNRPGDACKYYGSLQNLIAIQA